MLKGGTRTTILATKVLLFLDICKYLGKIMQKGGWVATFWRVIVCFFCSIWWYMYHLLGNNYLQFLSHDCIDVAVADDEKLTIEEEFAGIRFFL